LEQNHPKSKIVYTKNNNIFKKVFSYLNKKIFLEIAKYNKKIKNKLSLDINGYKEGTFKYSSIEIEIIPIKSNYVRFINTVFNY